MAAPRAYSDDTATELLAEYRRTGDRRYRDAVVEQFRPLVRSVARRFSGKEPLEDLESEGFVGLLRATERFAPERGARFSTFAMHLVAGQMRHYLRDRGHLIRQPAWLQELNGRVQRMAAELEQRLQRAPTIEEIAAAANLTEESVEELMAARQAAQTVRLDSPSDRDDDDFLEVDPEKLRSRDFHTFELPIEDRIVLENAMRKLKDLERKVLYYFFFQDCNQSEIARELGISCNYTGHVLRNGLKHMRERLPGDPHAPVARPGEDGITDPGTGLYNRAHFEARLAEEIHRAQRYEQELAVCCLRLPDDVAESVVQAAAGVLRSRVRRSDILARTGAAEFGVIFPCTGAVVDRVAERLVEQLHSVVRRPIDVASAIYPDGGRSAQQLFGSARDAATGERDARALPR